MPEREESSRAWFLQSFYKWLPPRPLIREKTAFKSSHIHFSHWNYKLRWAKLVHHSPSNSTLHIKISFKCTLGKVAKSGTWSVDPWVQLGLLKILLASPQILARRLFFFLALILKLLYYFDTFKFFSSLKAGTWYGKLELKELRAGKQLKKGRFLLMSKISNRWFH